MMVRRAPRKPGAAYPRCILVAVDGSEHSLRAARVAVALAVEAHAPLRAVTVVQVPLAVYPTGGFAPVVDYSGEFRGHLIQKAGQVLARVEKMAGKAGVSVRTKVLEGHVPSQIVRHAKKERADLIVVGSRGLSGVSRWLMGSVSTALVQQARMSVLVVR
jgi:nucleotide-binding universal stress UspA family protein